MGISIESKRYPDVVVRIHKDVESGVNFGEYAIIEAYISVFVVLIGHRFNLYVSDYH